MRSPVKKIVYTSLGFEKIVAAVKNNYIFDIRNKKQKASGWKKEIVLITGLLL